MPTDIAKYLTERVPRYTSYPTAPHFSAAVDGATYRGWLRALPEAARLSLYLHVPFCRSLCWYCGCHTKVPAHRDPIDRYVADLESEIDLVAEALGSRRSAVHIHWGGGTPTIVGPRAFAAVTEHLRRRFAVDAAAEIAVEIDPRRLDREMAAALAGAGVNRASLGVQSFDLRVQRRSTASRAWSRPRPRRKRCARPASIASTSISSTACRTRPRRPAATP